MSTDYYIVALAAADFAATSLLVYVIIFNADQKHLTDFSCKFLQYIRRCAAIASLMLTALVACDRYVIVCQPFGLRTNLKRSAITITLGIAYSMISQLFWAIDGNVLENGETKICAYTGPEWLGTLNGVNSASMFGFSTVFCAVLYTKIYLKIKQHRKKTGNLQQRPQPSTTKPSNVSVTQKFQPFCVKNTLKNSKIHTVDEPSSQELPLERNVTDVTRITAGLGTNVAPDMLDEGPSTSVRTISKSRMGPARKMNHVEYRSTHIRSPSPSDDGTERCHLPTILLSQKCESETGNNTNLGHITSKNIKSSQERPARKNNVQFTWKSSQGFMDNLLPEQESDKADSPYSPTPDMTKCINLPGSAEDEIQKSSTQQKTQFPSWSTDQAPSSFSVLNSVVSQTRNEVLSELPSQPVPEKGRYNPNGNGQRKPREDTMTKMLLITTVIFFLTTLPAACVENIPSHILNEYQGTRFGEFTIMSMVLIRFVNHFINVFVYGLVNARFRKEALKVINCCRRK